MDNNVDSQNAQSEVQANPRRRRLGLLVAGIGFGSLIAYLISKVAGRGAQTTARDSVDNIVDDRGTGQSQAAQILRNLRDRAFEASDEKLALALGRPLEEITDWNAGQKLIDDDVVMKARGIAMHRGVHVE